MAKEHFPYVSIVAVVAIVGVVVLLFSLKTTVKAPAAGVAEEAVVGEAGRPLSKVGLPGVVQPKPASGTKLKGGQATKSEAPARAKPTLPDFRIVDVEWQEFSDIPGQVGLPDLLFISVQNVGDTGISQYHLIRAYPVINQNTGELWSSSLSGLIQLGDPGGANGQRIWFTADPVADVTYSSNPYGGYDFPGIALYKMDPYNIVAEANEGNNCGLYHTDTNAFEALATCPDTWGGVRLSDYN